MAGWSKLVEPTRTVLQYLREDLRRTGSKEGCAEGDCGACTVVIAELTGDELRYRAVNACIQFLPTLDGKALFTVESLKAADGSLHPVQQSMVDYHGSQCGFCTPGFIMSMYALYKNNPAPGRSDIDDALSGNLCRCTGYRPIIEACLHMYDYPAPQDNEQQLRKQLLGLRRATGQSLELERGRYYAPASVDELASLYQQHPSAQILAGGTDVGLWVTKQLRELPVIIYLGNVVELSQIKSNQDNIEVGAAVTLSDACDAICTQYPEFTEMFRRFASVPVRNAGTLVGNGDDVREMALEDLYLDYMKNVMQPGEFIEAIEIPARDEHLALRCYKLSKRFDQDISAVCAAFAIRLDGDIVSEIRIALGGMAAIPKRALLTEKLLTGGKWDESSLTAGMEKLAEDFAPLSDMRASADYRGRATANLLYRFYLETRSQQPLDSEAVNVFAVSG
jgi:xanthine dehydrogenase small subunit